MSKHHKHLTKDDRFFIQESMKEGMSVRAIASKLGKSHSTIYRELERNSNEQGIYEFESADIKVQKRHFRVSK